MASPITLSADEVFVESLKAFQGSLTEADREIFRNVSSADELLYQLMSAGHERAAGSYGRRAPWYRQIDNFSQRLAPYFDVITAFVQIKPDILGGFWGSVLLICKLASNYVTWIEKVAGLLESISNALPQYHDRVQICRNRADIQPERLLKSLSWVYADILDICQQIYLILSPGSSSSKWTRRMGFTGRRMWQPFDVKFKSAIERLDQHRQIFDQEMVIQDEMILTNLQHGQKALQQQLGKLQMSLSDTMLKKILEDIVDSERTLTGYYATLKESITPRGITDMRASFNKGKEQLLPWYEALRKSMDSSARGTTIPEEELIELAARRAPGTCRKIKEWMSATDFRGVYEEASHNRIPGSGIWFLDAPEYVSWRDGEFERTVESPNTLLVQAKPGFGKTYLSTTVIDDLPNIDQFTGDPVLDSDRPVTAFYHFSRNSLLPDRNTTAAALRALVTQIVHSCQKDPFISDTMLVLWGSLGSSGQLVASQNDAEQVLAILLQQRSVYIVLDGVDECRDIPMLFAALSRVQVVSHSKWLFLSRPDITYPRWIDSVSQEVLLTAIHNSADIDAWLRQEFQSIAEDALFGPSGIPEGTMENAHRNSNGIFLWAKLFTKYLRSPALTPRDRLNFVEAALAFDGLDSLFSHILRRLSKRSQPENGITAKLFRWLATSLYPLIAEEMETALAITPGEQTMDVDHLLNFPAIVPQITGSLVELDLAGRLAFIHLSVRDFLASVRSDQFPDFALPSFTERNLELALVCLSYLAHDIPRQPIFKIVPRGLLQPWNDNISSLPDSEGVLPTFHGGEMRMSKLRRKRGIANGLSSSLTGDAREISRRNVAASSALIQARLDRTEEMLPRMLPNQDGSTSRIRTSRFGQTQGYREGADEDEVYIPAQEPMASITPAIVSHQVFPERIAGPMATGTWNTEKSYPLLRYASLCWAQHLFTSLPADDRNFAAPIEPGIPITSVDTRRHDLETFIPASQPVWLPYLSRFLLSRPSVTNWVQACYAFHLVPPVWKLINPMLALAHRTSKSTAEGREIHWVLHGVVQLRDAVNELEHNYRAALVSNPSLLWQPDITSTTDRNFWPTWTIEEEEHDDRLGPPTLSIRVPRPFAARQILGPI